MQAAIHRSRVEVRAEKCPDEYFIAFPRCPRLLHMILPLKPHKNATLNLPGEVTGLLYDWLGLLLTFLLCIYTSKVHTLLSGQNELACLY